MKRTIIAVVTAVVCLAAWSGAHLAISLEAYRAKKQNEDTLNKTFDRETVNIINELARLRSPEEVKLGKVIDNYLKKTQTGGRTENCPWDGRVGMVHAMKPELIKDLDVCKKLAASNWPFVIPWSKPEMVLVGASGNEFKPIASSGRSSDDAFLRPTAKHTVSREDVFVFLTFFALAFLWTASLIHSHRIDYREQLLAAAEVSVEDDWNNITQS